MDKNVEALRLQLLANGYSPIRNVDKRTFMPSWPTATLDEAEIRSWTRKFSRHGATGLRVENGLCVIDFDVDDKEAMDAIADAVVSKYHVLGSDGVLVRWGKGAKEAWFLRCEEIFTRLHTRAFIRPGETADMQTHRVEIFGGASPRQFGSFGAHTRDEQTGETLVAYEWADDISPAAVKLDDLLEVPKAVLWDVIDIAERVLQDLGWQIFERSKRGESASGKVYDLTPEMIFECNDDVDRTLDELREAAKAEEGLRCSASWLEGPTAVNRTRCLVSLSRSGGVAIWESMEGVTHLEKSAEPVDYGPEIDRIAEKLKELEERRRRKIKSADDCLTAAAKMREAFAYCPSQKLSVVPVWSTSLEEGYMMQPFRLMFMPNRMEEVGPRGGVKMINPVDLWMADEVRITVDGLRMRPDQPRPVFEEDGKKFINVYSPPHHKPGVGDVRPGIDFLVHLLPDPEEREWFIRWLAFKMRYPHIPGPAVVMVAHATFGTGRGTLAELVGRLFGKGYVRQLDYKDFTGKTYQAQYNDWQGDALMVCVNESSEIDGGSQYQTKHNTYEHLKEVVEVRPTMRKIRMKGERNYWALSSTSFLIFTNHMDALPIPEHDRRFSVLQNGQPKPVEYWQRLNKWMDDEENVAALAHWLADYDLADYSPFATPPTFAGKAAMIDEAKSDLDRAIETSLENMPGEVFTAEQLEKYVRLVADGEAGIELPRPLSPVIRKVVRKTLRRVGVRHGKNWLPQIEGKRFSVYARSEGRASYWSDAEADELRDEVLRNGPADGSGNSNLIAGLFKR